MTSTKCPTCQAYDGHSFDCPDIDPETAKRMLKEYHKAWTEAMKPDREKYERYRQTLARFQREATFWQGKFAILCRENNALRKKVV